MRRRRKIKALPKHHISSYFTGSNMTLHRRREREEEKKTDLLLRESEEKKS
jgi:hypothetical protein